MNFEAPFETQESYVKESKTKIIWLSLTVIFIICGILMAIFHPEAEFTWLVGSTKYYLGLFIVALVCIYNWLAQFCEHRKEKYYFTPEGKLDLSTPRFYSKLKRPKLIEIFNKGGLDEFAYDGEGNVHFVTSKGKTITSPLSDLTVKYTMDKAGREEWRIYKMTVTTPSDEKIKFTTGSTLLPFPSLTDAEYDDIHMILSTAGTLKESKTSKASKWVDKINSASNDLDFSGFFGKSDKCATDNKVIGFVKAKIGVNHKKKSWFKRAMEYFWLTVGILYIAIVLIINITALPEIFGGVDNNYNEYLLELEDENSIYSEDEVMVPVVSDESVETPTNLSLYGSYAEIYLKMDITIDPNTQDKYNVSGRGYFETDDGNKYFELQGIYSENGNLVLQEKSHYTDYEDANVVFKGILEVLNGELIYKGSRYWDGQEAGDFYLRVID